MDRRRFLEIGGGLVAAGFVAGAVDLVNPPRTDIRPPLNPYGTPEAIITTPLVISTDMRIRLAPGVPKRDISQLHFYDRIFSRLRPEIPWADVKSINGVSYNGEPYLLLENAPIVAGEFTGNAGGYRDASGDWTRLSFKIKGQDQPAEAFINVDRYQKDVTDLMYDRKEQKIVGPTREGVLFRGGGGMKWPEIGKVQPYDGSLQALWEERMRNRIASRSGDYNYRYYSDLHVVPLDQCAELPQLYPYGVAVTEAPEYLTWRGHANKEPLGYVPLGSRIVGGAIVANFMAEGFFPRAALKADVLDQQGEPVELDNNKVIVMGDAQLLRTNSGKTVCGYGN